MTIGKKTMQHINLKYHNGIIAWCCDKAEVEREVIMQIM